MELTERLQADIAGIFKTVKYGDITFHVSPEKKTLDYDVKTTGKLPIDEQQNNSKLALDRN